MFVNPYLVYAHDICALIAIQKDIWSGWGVGDVGRDDRDKFKTCMCSHLALQCMSIVCPGRVGCANGATNAWTFHSMPQRGLEAGGGLCPRSGLEEETRFDGAEQVAGIIRPKAFTGGTCGSAGQT